MNGNALSKMTDDQLGALVRTMGHAMSGAHFRYIAATTHEEFALMYMTCERILAIHLAIHGQEASPPPPPPVPATTHVTPMPDVTRLVVVDHREASAGRVLDEWGVMVTLNLQDDGRTLKVFFSEGHMGPPKVD